MNRFLPPELKLKPFNVVGVGDFSLEQLVMNKSLGFEVIPDSCLVLEVSRTLLTWWPLLINDYQGGF